MRENEIERIRERENETVWENYHCQTAVGLQLNKTAVSVFSVCISDTGSQCEFPEWIFTNKMGSLNVCTF